MAFIIFNTLITVNYMFKLTCRKCITAHHLQVLKMEAYIMVIVSFELFLI